MVKNDEFRTLGRPELEAAVVAERRRLDALYHEGRVRLDVSERSPPVAA